MMDKEKDIFELISEICESDNINDGSRIVLKKYRMKNQKSPHPLKLSAL